MAGLHELQQVRECGVPGSGKLLQQVLLPGAVSSSVGQQAEQSLQVGHIVTVCQGLIDKVKQFLVRAYPLSGIEVLQLQFFKGNFR